MISFPMICRRSIRLVCSMAAAALMLSAGPARGFETVRCYLADGFEYPVGRPPGSGYFKARGFWPNGHLGEDWNGNGGGDSDLGDPIYAVGRGVVVLSEDVKLGWGNCVIIRHVFREASGKIDMVDSLYGHLLERKVRVGQMVERGELIGKMGNNNGMYPAHLHLEIRKNLAIGMNRTKFARDYSNYYSPTAFIQAHRQLAGESGKYEVPVNTFAPHGQDLNQEQIAFANSRGTAATASSGSSSKGGSKGGGGGGGDGGSRGSSSVKKTPGGLSIPMGTRTGGGTTKDSSVPKVADRTEPKGKPGKGEKKEPVAAPTMVPPTEPKSDFWTRLKSKINSGQVVDPSGPPK